MTATSTTTTSEKPRHPVIPDAEGRAKLERRFEAIRNVVFGGADFNDRVCERLDYVLVELGKIGRGTPPSPYTPKTPPA